MKIISKFQDYYDMGLYFGIDENQIFYRKRYNSERYDNDINAYSILKYSEIKNNLQNERILIEEKKNSNVYLSISYTEIFFCGKKYNAVLIEINDKTNDYRYQTNNGLIEKTFIYSFKDFESIIEKYNVKISDSYFQLMNSETLISQQLLKKIKEFLNNQGKIIPNECFIEMEAPYCIYNSWNNCEFTENNPKYVANFAVNPILKNFGFAKMLNPIEAFQEVSMFIGGVLHLNEVKTVDIKDKDMLHSKGFDCMSFKKRGAKDKKCKS